MKFKKTAGQNSSKALTGIAGFDESPTAVSPAAARRSSKERNRGLSIIKSRGTSHSNQVRELILSDAGVTLADIYTAGGEVLMGTMRWEKESAERLAKEVADVAGKLKRVSLDAEESVLKVRAKSLQTELLAKQVEKALLARATQSKKGEVSRGRTRMRELRGGDAALPERKASRS